MLDHLKVINALRQCADPSAKGCEGCPYSTRFSPCAACMAQLLNDASDDIQELTTRKEGQ